MGYFEQMLTKLRKTLILLNQHIFNKSIQAQFTYSGWKFEEKLEHE